MAKPARVALYVRTSTADQHGKAQLHALRKASKARGWASPEEFVDIGLSGANARRPRLDALRAAVQRGDIRAVMVTALDRLGRSLRDLMDLFEELRAAGCMVVSLREGVDLTTAAGRAFAGVLGVLAEFERELICERVRAGLTAAKARGERLGRPQVRPAYEPVAALRAQSRSWAEIAAALRCTPSSARRAFADGPNAHQTPTPRPNRGAL